MADQGILFPRAAANLPYTQVLLLYKERPLVNKSVNKVE
jgi:hypothetical protein